MRQIEDVMLPASLKHLAKLLAPAVRGPVGLRGSVEPELVKLAIYRHQVGPLLHAALQGSGMAISDELLVELSECRLRSANRHAEDLARLQRIGAILAAHRLSWMVLKGTPQAARLYGDPALRPSSDIDLLVEPRDFVRAVSALAERGYIPSNPPAPAGPIRTLVLAAVRDVSLIAEDDHKSAVDLHRRLFLAVGRRPNGLHLSRDPGPLPTPRVNADLACYLIMHGAQSYWVRLKWLLDLVPLLAILEEQEKHALISRARQIGVENSVIASLALLRLLFPFAKFGPLAPWLEAHQRRPAVRERLERYVRMIGMERDWKHSPLDNARVTMQAYWALFEAPLTRARMIPVALLSSAIRRTAGAIWRAERALTRDDTPPPDQAQAGLPTR
jgi:hypothetical protein